MDHETNQSLMIRDNVNFKWIDAKIIVLLIKF